MRLYCREQACLFPTTYFYMNRQQHLIQSVSTLYTHSEQSFAQWGFKHHVEVVAKWAKKIAQDQHANVEFCIIAAYLHDIADVWLDGRPDGHDEASETKARELLKQAGYTKEEVDEITVTIIRPHSCYPENMPESLEAKVFATADAMAHLSTNFYVTFVWNHWKEDSLEAFSVWLLKKIDRDFHTKIFWDQYREQVKPMYEALQVVFGKDMHDSTT